MPSKLLLLSLRALAAVLLLASLPAAAQTTSVAALSDQLAQAERDVATVDRALDARVDDEQRDDLRTKALAAKDAATEAAARLQEQLTLVDAKVAQLGTPSAGAGEAGDIRAQRAALQRQHSALDSAVKRGRLLGVTAQQLIDEIAQGQAAQFGERLSAHSPSPLSPTFWRAVLLSAPRDLRRIAATVTSGIVQARTQSRGSVPWQALVGALVFVMVLGPGRLALRRVGQRFLIEGAPGHRVRRSGYAIWRIAVGTLTPLCAAFALVQGIRWGRLEAASWSPVFDGLIAAMTFAGLTLSATGALLMRNQSSWRVATISDTTATRLRPFSILLAALSFATIMVDTFNRAVNASGAARVASQVAEASLHLLLLAATLLALGRLRAEQANDEQGQTARAGLGAVTLLAWGIVLVAGAGLLFGYIALSLFMVQLVAWGAVLGSATYLLMTAIDDITTSLFKRSSVTGRTLVRALGLRGSSVDQFGVLLSGVLRLIVAVTAVGLLLSPFGAGNGVTSLFGRLGTLAQGVEIGGVSVSPGTIVRGLVVLFVGLALVRAFMGWLEGRYLPATDLDGSGQNSVRLVARYVGIALAVIWALASLGIGMERIALLLSALSVGIGFGLQAITSNFVSGLILLAERPIKIGDLVRVGTDEGDVKRISVRSTEIELADHSTLIVPNSELITKSVLNKTMASPMGRIQIQFSVPLGTQVARVRELVLESFAAEPAVLGDPAPSAFVDSIADGRILFNCFAHVATPRAAYSARSAVFMALLGRFHDEGIDIGTVPQRLEMVAAPTPADGRSDKKRDAPETGDV
ncbi:DUF3772 domain-containing protein [uncultured Sphingomonas sp.]|uniref:DUF3772 domain-containing protein n=1 Tax=uncultured Sphingomonas sp. TaxID=158754 RepID=UPI0025D0CA96|nr:DUF3772 domain-containing protein [uncultured Sphingomonas sp.]